MASDQTIPAGLRADVMRKQMESKNTLDTKGSIYVGKGTATTVATNVTVADTGKLAPGSNGLPLIADSTTTLGLKYAKLGKGGLGSMINTGSASANGITVTLGQVNVLGNDARFNIGITCSKVNWSSYAEQLNFTFNTDTLITPRDLIYVTGSTDGYKLQVHCATNDNLEIRNVLIDDVNCSMTWYGNDTRLMTVQGTGSGTTITQGILNVNGQVKAISFAATSDFRLKENIKDYQYHDSILDIPVKEYDFIDSKEHAIGFIAQDLQEKYPELVVKDKEGYLSIKETKLIYLLLKEVKELKKELKELKRED